MFGIGFLGTQAPFYMDVITLYFGVLPFLMGSAIYMAVKKNYTLHKRMNLTIYAVTLGIVVLFEVGVRISGGFAYFVQSSNATYSFMITFLFFHILVAFISVVAYTLLTYKTVTKLQNHRKFGKLVYLGMTVTSITGVMIYYFLFIY